MSEDYLPFFEFIDSMPVKITDVDDLKGLVSELEAYHLFDSAAKVQGWEAAFKQYIAEEFDDECLTKPIPQWEPYSVETFTKSYDECDLEGGWIHEQELQWYGYEYNEDGSL